MRQSTFGLAMSLFVMVAMGLALMVGPFFVPQIQGIGRSVLVTIGAAVLAIGLLGTVITKLYVRSRPDMAFVRSGLGGPKVVLDGGAIVFPVFHEVKWIPTNTMRIDVSRSGSDALITQDKLRARVKANFFIKIAKDAENVKNAASSLPDMTRGPQVVEELISEKLVGALRTVATSQTLNELNSDRQRFQEEVQRALAEDLKLNGLQLESVNISELDQEDPSSMNPDSNILDAEGMKTITEITTRNKILRTQMEADAQRRIKDQNVETAKYLAEKDREEKQALAEADAQKRTVQAQRNQEAEQAEAVAATEVTKKKAQLEAAASIESAKQKNLAETERIRTEQAIAIQESAKSQEVAVRTAAATQAEKVAQVAADQAAQLALREQAIAVAEAEQRRAAAEAERLHAEKIKAEADQQMQTAIAVETANREKERSVIAQQAEAEQQRIKAQIEADTKAYAVGVQARAEKEAAENRAAALIRQAEADQQAAKLRSEGRRADELVPVQVEAERVEVERKRVEVLEQELKAKSEHAAVSVELEKALKLIDAAKEVGVSQAQSLGAAFAKTNFTVWGDPTVLEKVQSAFGTGQGMSAFLNGLMTNLPKEFSGVANLVKTHLDRAPEIGDGNGHGSTSSNLITPPTEDKNL